MFAKVIEAKTRLRYSRCFWLKPSKCAEASSAPTRMAVRFWLWARRISEGSKAPDSEASIIRT